MFLTLTVVLAMSSLAPGGPPTRHQLIGWLADASSVQLVPSLKQAPPSYAQTLRDAVYRDVSDVGGPFSAGCVFSKESPSVRFLFGAKSRRYWLAAFEHGGIMHGYGFAIFERKPHDVFITKAFGGLPDNVRDLPSLQRAVRAGIVDAQPVEEKVSAKQ